jgi:hypothetical protein
VEIFAGHTPEFKTPTGEYPLLFSPVTKKTRSLFEKRVFNGAASFILLCRVNEGRQMLVQNITLNDRKQNGMGFYFYSF